MLLEFGEELDPSNSRSNVLQENNVATTIELRLGIKRSESGSISMVIDEDDYQEHLQNLPKIADVLSIKCKMCGSELVDSTTKHELNRIISMPSEHWLELRDLWVCHEGKST